MKRIWFLWLAVTYVVAHLITVPLALYLGQWWLAGVGIFGSVIVGCVVWPLRGYLWDRNEY